MRILIVGAGIVGAALADRLTRPERQVTVVEGLRPGAGTSGTSYGWLNANDPRVAHFPDEGYAHGESASRSLVQRAAAAGAEVVTGRRAVRLTLDGGRVTGVRLNDGRDMPADLTICAAGRYSPALLSTAGITLPLVDPAAPGSAAPCLVATTTATDGVLNGLVHAPGLSARAAENGGLVLEADDLDAGIDESVPPERVRAVGEELLARARAVIPRLDAEIADVRRCVRPLPIDGYPLIGPQAPGLYTAVTHSGMTLAALLAALIDREIDGEAAPELAPYRPDRPFTNTGDALGLPAAHHADEQVDALRPHLLHRGADAAQRDRELRGDGHVAEADDGDLPARAQAAFAQHAEHADRGEVADREDRGRVRVAVEEPLGGERAARRVEARVHDAVRRHGVAALGEVAGEGGRAVDGRHYDEHRLLSIAGGLEAIS